MSAPVTAVVLAAGLSTRLGGAADEPKPLLSVGGMPILHRAVENLRAVGVQKVVLVVGHRAEEITSSLDGFLSQGAGRDVAVEYVRSDRYRTTNNVFSLWLARDHLRGDVYLLDGDVVFDAELLRALDLADGQCLAAVRPHEPGMTGTMAELDNDNRIVRMVDVRDGETPTPGARKTASVYLLRAPFLRDEFLPGLGRLVAEGGTQHFYEAVIADAIEGGRQDIRGVDCGHLRWCEIDDVGDWTTAEFLFSDPDQRFALLARSHGHFQQPGVIDHLLLTNVYFPPEAMRHDLARELDRLMTDYPAGQAAIARLMAGVVGHPPSRLVVANGASELIKIICGSVPRRTLVAVPGFNEYEQAVLAGQLLRFQLEPPAFRLDTESFSRAAEEGDAELAVVISPNNPTSLAVPRDELLALAETLARRNTLLLVEESLLDFCADPASQSVESAIDAHPNLSVLKTFSAVCGIPGLRLAYLLTANEEFAAGVRARLPIWNVNAVAEAFLRLLPRYTASLEESCRRVRRECDELASLLQEIPGVDVLPPSASFCLVRLPEDASGPEVARRLFVEHDHLVKECSGKSMPEGHRYLRIKSRTPAENVRLAAALRSVLANPMSVDAPVEPTAPR
jgi:histidinol-phosphate/aromatic aminotransferase/cobyric acid decarboxylase-like protein/NDP-sugar pyrophosphorylase family protein